MSGIDNFENDDVEESLVSENDRLVIDEGETEEGWNESENESSQLSDNDSGSSDSDVIFVERDEEEVIELSDEEAHNRKIFQNVKVPPSLLVSLQEASRNIHKVVAKNRKNKVEAREVIAEISNQVWSLPWECVSAIFNNPNVLSQKSAPKKLVKKKNDVEKVVKTSSNATISKTPNKVRIKEEKFDSVEDDRNLTVIHFDPDKPPEFCEISRSGRLIKKPARLNSIAYSDRPPNRQKKKTNNNESLELTDSDSSGVYDELQEEIERRLNASSSKQKNTQNCSNQRKNLDPRNALIQEPKKIQENVENSNVTQDLSNIGSDSDGSTSTYMTEIFVGPHSKRGSYTEDSKLSKHNSMERKRRQELSRQYHDLVCSVLEVRHDIQPGKFAKVEILNEGRTTIKLLEQELKMKETRKQELLAKKRSYINFIRKNSL